MRRNKKRFINVALLFMLSLSLSFVYKPVEVFAASLTWPVPGHTALSQGFHDGCAIDISDGNIAGATVVAALGGTVTHRFDCGIQHYGSMHNCNGFGTGIVIQGDDGRIYQYAHMQGGSIPANVTVGARVSQGQMIGRVGTTGNSSGNHLHFGISYGTYYSQNGVDPSKESYSYSPANRAPDGCFRVAVGGEGTVFVRGWAYDPDDMSNQIAVDVYIGAPLGDPNAEGHRIRANKNDPEGNNSGANHGFSETIVTGKTGHIPVYCYAVDTSMTSNTLLSNTCLWVDVTKDSTAPTVKDVVITNQDSDGYTVSCKVTDSGSGVNRVQFPTWTTKDGQDDLVANWTTNSAIKGTKSGDTYTFRVKRSAHNNEYGEYFTDIYAWDNAGNETGLVKHLIVNLEKPHTHSLVRTAAKPATTTAEGNIEYWTCSSCGKIFKDAEGKIEITKAETVIPKLTEPGSSDSGGSNGTESAAAPATQMGTDGTSLGNGASIAAAEAAIAGMTDDNDLPGSVFGKLQLRSKKQTKTSVTLSWKKIPGATSYVIYGNKCGSNNKMQRLATSAGKSMKFTSVLGRKVKKGTYYKFMIIALDNNNNVVSASKIVHVATKGGKVGNVGKVTTRAKKNKVSVKTGKTFKLSGKQKPADKKLKVKKHRPVTYESSNPQIATVSKKGVLKGNTRGTCYVYAYAQNGVFAKVKVTVK